MNRVNVENIMRSEYEFYSLEVETEPNFTQALVDRERADEALLLMWRVGVLSDTVFADERKRLGGILDRRIDGGEFCSSKV